MNSLNDIYESLGDSLIRLLTFQSKEVIDTLYKDGVYYADTSKSREKQDYSKDIEQLNGYNPIWCFSPLGYKEENKVTFSKEEFIDGCLFERFRCEMSLNGSEPLNDLYLLEIEIPAKYIKIGLTHNAYSKAVVISQILSSDVLGLYRLYYNQEEEYGWFFPSVNVCNTFREDSLFTEDFKCRNI